MKVLITGGAGYVGTELLYKLIEREDIKEITVYDNLSRANYNVFIGVQKLNNEKVNFINGDLLDSRKLKKAVKDANIIYHLAAKATTPFADQNPHLFEQVNHWGTAELGYAIEEADDVQKVIYLSSVSVYGSGEKEVDVNSEPNPRTFYGTSKMRGEEHMQRLMDKTKTWIVRCGNVYGYSKSMRFDAVINKFMFDANYTGRITINGDGQQNRAFIHIDRAVEALTNLLDSDLPTDTYNLVNRNLKIVEVTEHINEVYPELEFLFVNQHLKLRQIKVQPDERINKLIHTVEKSFVEELKDFKTQFTF